MNIAVFLIASKQIHWKVLPKRRLGLMSMFFLHPKAMSWCIDLVDVINKRWNKALWLDVASHMASFSQSECFISSMLLKRFFWPSRQWWSDPAPASLHSCDTLLAGAQLRIIRGRLHSAKRRLLQLRRLLQQERHAAGQRRKFWQGKHVGQWLWLSWHFYDVCLLVPIYSYLKFFFSPFSSESKVLATSMSGWGSDTAGDLQFVESNLINLSNQGSGCGSVGRAVASDTEVHSSNPVIGEVLLNIVNCQLYWKMTKIKKKRPGMAYF